MSIGKKILLGIIVFIAIFLILQQIYLNTDEGKKAVAESKAKTEAIEKILAEGKELDKARELAGLPPDRGESESDIEKRMENMVLNYKGIDGKGFTIKDFSDARCGDNQNSFAQYLGDSFDGKSNYHHVMIHSPVNIDWNPPCLGAGWHFGVNNQGDVIAWDYSSERQDILDYLDTQGK